MAMVFTEGFDSYISATSLRNRFATVEAPWTISPTGGRVSGPCAFSNGSVGGAALRLHTLTFPGTSQTFSIGFWVNIASPPASTTTMFRLVTTGGEAWRLRVELTSGRLVLDDSSIIRASGFLSVADADWHWVEFQLAGGAGACYVDHILQWSSGATGIISPTWSYFEFLSLLDRAMFVDDILVFNNASGFPQTADHPIGATILSPFRPQGDTEDFHEFDRSTGASNAALVREAILNISNWVQSDVVADQDLYAYDTALPTDPPPDTIHAAVLTTQLRNPDVGTVTFNHIARSGSTQATATAQAAPTARRVKQDGFPVDPATSAEWTASGLNAAEFGVRVAGVS